MTLDRIDPPANLDDFDDQQRDSWSRFLSNEIDENISSYNLKQFYNPTKIAPGTDVVSQTIDWTAFPKNLTVTTPTDRARWRTADSTRHVQDEYCEWSMLRDLGTGKIRRVVFTSEGPEYWRFLANTNRAKLVELYAQLLGQPVPEGDLFLPDGTYNPRNQWNAATDDGNIVHLIHVNNTLGAFVNIGARATIVREIEGTVLTGELELIRCGKYGGENRHSDPHIGGEVNALARQKADVALANPMALYIHGLFPVGWTTPDGSNPLDYWKIVRGTEEHGLRAVYEVPADRDFTVGDIQINDRPIEFGAQIADFIKIKLVGQACRFGQSTAQPVIFCEGEGPSTPFVAVATPDLQDEEQTARRG